MKLTLFALDIRKAATASEAVELSDEDGCVQRFNIAELSHWELGYLAPHLSRIDEVVVGWGDLPHLDFLRFLPNVVKARIITDAIKDISGLRHLSKLKSLAIDRPTCRMEVLGELQTLEDLYLDDWRPGSQSVFSLQRLHKVGIQNFGHASLEPTSGWSQLEELWLNSGLLEDLTGVPTTVKQLRLTNIKRLRSLAPLVCCSQLEGLRLEGCKQVNSLDGLDNCYALRVLCVSNAGTIKSLDPLRKLKKLQYLAISDRTVVEQSGIDAVYSLPQLKTLIISQRSGLDKDKLLHTSPGCDVCLTTL